MSMSSSSSITALNQTRLLRLRTLGPKFLWTRSGLQLQRRCASQFINGGYDEVSLQFRKLLTNPNRFLYNNNNLVLRRAIHIDTKITRSRLCHFRRTSSLSSPVCIHAAPFSSTGDDPSLAWKKSGKTFNEGPDQILPSTTIRTWLPDGAVELSKLSTGELARQAPISVPTLLKIAAQRSPHHTALAVKRNNEWEKWTYKQYLDDVRTAAKAFIALGLERYHSVCILGFNSPEWFIADLAAIHAGGFAAGIYTTNCPEACAFVAKDSKANIFVVEDEKQLNKVLLHRRDLPHLKAIVQYIGKPTEKGVYSWSNLMELGRKQPDTVLEERLKSIAVNQCCTLLYTSGTTGNPKGVMLSHDNFTWLASANGQMVNFVDCGEDCVSFLPLSHVAAQIGDLYCPLVGSAAVYFADPSALKGTLIDTLREVEPTKFMAVPRVWEKMHERLREVERKSSGVKKQLLSWARGQGLDYNMKLMRGTAGSEPLSFKIANKIVFSKVRKALGLSRCNLQLSGAAPINHDILKYFMSFNIIVTEVYGMSESSGPHTMGLETAHRLGSVGKNVWGVVTKVDQPDSNGVGELWMGGRHVCMGYLNLADKTQDVIDKNGWLHTEDLGRIDKDGYVYITGRLKELIITAGGENVPPVPIEEKVKKTLPIMNNAMLLGDKLKFLSILLTLKSDVNKDTLEPLDTLLPFTKEWIKKKTGCSVNTVQDVLNEVYQKKNPKFISVIQAGIDEVNKKAYSNPQMIQKWYILPRDFSIPGGELGPTLKLKRSVVEDKYKSVIDQLYQDELDPNDTEALG